MNLAKLETFGFFRRTAAVSSKCCVRRDDYVGQCLVGVFLVDDALTVSGEAFPAAPPSRRVAPFEKHFEAEHAKHPGGFGSCLCSANKLNVLKGRSPCCYLCNSFWKGRIFFPCSGYEKVLKIRNLWFTWPLLIIF